MQIVNCVLVTLLMTGPTGASAVLLQNTPQCTGCTSSFTVSSSPVESACTSGSAAKLGLFVSVGKQNGACYGVPGSCAHSDCFFTHHVQCRNECGVNLTLSSASVGANCTGAMTPVTVGQISNNYAGPDEATNLISLNCGAECATTYVLGGASGYNSVALTVGQKCTVCQ